MSLVTLTVLLYEVLKVLLPEAPSAIRWCRDQVRERSMGVCRCRRPSLIAFALLCRSFQVTQRLRRRKPNRPRPPPRKFVPYGWKSPATPEEHQRISEELYSLECVRNPPSHRVFREPSRFVLRIDMSFARAPFFLVVRLKASEEVDEVPVARARAPGPELSLLGGADGLLGQFRPSILLPPARPFSEVTEQPVSSLFRLSRSRRRRGSLRLSSGLARSTP